MSAEAIIDCLMFREVHMQPPPWRRRCLRASSSTLASPSTRSVLLENFFRTWPSVTDMCSRMAITPTVARRPRRWMLGGPKGFQGGARSEHGSRCQRRPESQHPGHSLTHLTNGESISADSARADSTVRSLVPIEETSSRSTETSVNAFPPRNIRHT